MLDVSTIDDTTIWKSIKLRSTIDGVNQIERRYKSTSRSINWIHPVVCGPSAYRATTFVSIYALYDPACTRFSFVYARVRVYVPGSVSPDARPICSNSIGANGDY